MTHGICFHLKSILLILLSFANSLPTVLIFEKLLGKDRVEGKIISTYQNEFNMCKMLDMHFDQRIADLKDLEKNGYSQALGIT